MKLEVKTYIKIPPDKEELDINQEYPGYIEMTNLKDLDVFNYAFGRSDGYPSGKVVFCVDDEPLQFNANVSEVYMFWNQLIMSLLTKDLYDIEKDDWILLYEKISVLQLAEDQFLVWLQV